MKINIFTFFLILLFCLCFLTGCDNSDGVETKAYVIALGVDKGIVNKFKLSLQVAILSGSSESSGSDSGSSSEPSTVLSVECSSIDSGINLINSYISKKINLSHCKVIIFSEELAKNGISDLIFNLSSNIEIRPRCHVLISRCNAVDFLKQSSPIFESNPANYYERIFNSSEYSGYVENTYLYNFYDDLLSTTSEADAILCGINTDSTHDQAHLNTGSLDGNYKADETPIESKNKAEIIGTAVFSDDKLVGELDNIETMCHLIITNELKNTIITIPNPYTYDTNISIFIGLNKNTKSTVSFVNGYPFIECNVDVIGDVLSMEQSINLNDINTVNLLNSYVSTYLEDALNSYLYKTSKEFKSDINDFGKYALPKYSTWNDWIDSDWLNNYQNAFFKVTVNTNIQDGYLFTKI